MKIITTLALLFAITACDIAAFAGRVEHGRPATTGVEHAEATANSRGDRGIENAEAKHAAHTHHSKHGKHKGKGHKKH